MAGTACSELCLQTLWQRKAFKLASAGMGLVFAACRLSQIYVQGGPGQHCHQRKSLPLPPCWGLYVHHKGCTAARPGNACAPLFVHASTLCVDLLLHILPFPDPATAETVLRDTGRSFARLWQHLTGPSSASHEHGSPLWLCRRSSGPHAVRCFVGSTLRVMMLVSVGNLALSAAGKTKGFWAAKVVSVGESSVVGPSWSCCCEVERCCNSRTRGTWAGVIGQCG